MRIILYIFIYLNINIAIINAFNYSLSSKVLIWNEHIKIFKCPIHAIEQYKEHIDPSILIFKNQQATQSLKTTHVIVANQTDYLTHNVKAFTIFNDFTFAYAIMATLEDLFDHIEIHNQAGYFEQKKYSNLEYIPDDEIINDLRNKSENNNKQIIELKNKHIYKCMGSSGSDKDNSIYLLLKSSNITANLKVNDIVFSDKSDGFLETIKQIDQIDVASNEHRLLIETELTDCSKSVNQDLIEKKIENLHLFKLENNELNCKGGFSSNSSLYVIKPSSYISRLNRQNSLLNSIIIGRNSHKFAYRIISIKKIGKYYLFETSDTLFPMKIRNKRGWFKRIFRKVVNFIAKVVSSIINFSVSWNWNLRKTFTHTERKNYDLTLQQFDVSDNKYKTIKIGDASVTLTLKPTITVSLGMQASLRGIHITKAGIVLDINANINAKFNLNTMSIDYDWPEKAIIPMKPIAYFVVPIGPVVLPGILYIIVFKNQAGLKIDFLCKIM